MCVDVGGRVGVGVTGLKRESFFSRQTGVGYLPVAGNTSRISTQDGCMR